MFSPYPRRALSAASVLFAWLLVMTAPRAASAHEGPPFPLVMDEPLAGHNISLWADPDIGEATFYVIVESPEGDIPQEVPNITLWTKPVSGRLTRQVYQTERQPLRNRLQFKAKPYFDRRDMWTVGVRIANAEAPPEELTTEVESTPPGFGPWDLAIYLFPFLMIGGMWVVAMVRRRRAAGEQHARLEAAEQPSGAERSEEWSGEEKVEAGT